jgi:hypothetical protein
VKIAALAVKKHATEKRQHGITEIAVQRGHGASLDASGKTVSHHQVVTGAQLFQEAGYMAEVVAVVSVAHNHKAAAGSTDTTHEGTPVSFLWHIDHTGSQAASDVLRAIAAAVICHHNFARNSLLSKDALDFFDAEG